MQYLDTCKAHRKNVLSHLKCVAVRQLHFDRFTGSLINHNSQRSKADVENIRLHVLENCKRDMENAIPTTRRNIWSYEVLVHDSWIQFDLHVQGSLDELREDTANFLEAYLSSGDFNPTEEAFTHLTAAGRRKTKREAFMLLCNSRRAKNILARGIMLGINIIQYELVRCNFFVVVLSTHWFASWSIWWYDGRVLFNGYTCCRSENGIALKSTDV